MTNDGMCRTIALKANIRSLADVRDDLQGIFADPCGINIDPKATILLSAERLRAIADNLVSI